MDPSIPKPLIKSITGVILAGGKSSRFGSNKALVSINGSRLIERVITVMKSIFEKLVIITNNPEDYSFLALQTHKDLIKGLGPIGGIYTGLNKIKDHKGFFVACDMPYINEKLIRHIIAVRGDFDAVIPKIDWRLEPLHALYSKSCLSKLKELIDSGVYQTNRSFKNMNIRYVNEEEIREHDPQLNSFININRPGELLDALGRDNKK